MEKYTAEELKALESRLLTPAERVILRIGAVCVAIAAPWGVYLAVVGFYQKVLLPYTFELFSLFSVLLAAGFFVAGKKYRRLLFLPSIPFFCAGALFYSLFMCVTFAVLAGLDTAAEIDQACMIILADVITEVSGRENPVPTPPDSLATPGFCSKLAVSLSFLATLLWLLNLVWVLCVKQAVCWRILETVTQSIGEAEEVRQETPTPNT